MNNTQPQEEGKVKYAYAGNILSKASGHSAGSTTVDKAVLQQWIEHYDRRKKRMRLIAIILLPIIVLCLALYLSDFFTRQQDSAIIVSGDLFPGVSDAQDGHLSNMTPDQIREQMQRAADASYFSFKINARPVFSNGASPGNLEIENPSYNIYPMVVQIVLDDTGEILYDSGGILPDQHIDSARLNKILEAGEYEATAYMNAYDPDTMLWAGRSVAKLIIIVID